MSASKEIIHLIYKHIREDLSVDEETRLQGWIRESWKHRQFFEEVTTSGYLFTEAMARERDDKQIDLEAAWEKISAVGLPTTSIPPISTTSKTRILPLRITRYLVAASVTLLLGVGAYVWLRPTAAPEVVVTKTVTHSHDVAPNTKEPTLTLADGTVVSLDSAQQGTLAMQGNTSVTKDAKGNIVYSPAVNAKGEMLYNTMTVPKGGNVVSLALADGSKVWLNAASSIRYPAAFAGNERKVEITGEAYFEVEHNNAMPFKVRHNDIDVMVYGTHFNVNAFPEEKDIRITLLEGSVNVTNTTTKRAQMITPGQQAVAAADGKIVLNKTVDIETVMAWKNGLFMFNNTRLEAIMQQVQRWYDVEVVYEKDDVKRWTFNGQISRYSNASKVLEMMEATGTVHFRIEDRKVYVTQ